MLFRSGWIPPVQLDVGPYESEIIDQTDDSVSVNVRSPQEVWTKHPMLPGLVFERRAVIYKNSSRVKLEQSMINTTDEEMTWSVWDVTQTVTQHGNERDFENFWAYFPIKKEESVFGENGVRTSASSQAWQGEVAPGVYGVQFLPQGKKIFADSPEGWIAYVDEREGYAYFKVFEIWEGENYPDGGARNEVWINSSPPYMEIEVLSPIWAIPADSGKITFVIDWYAAKMNGPIKHANHVGAINKNLGYQNDTSRLEAIYGVFHEGTAKVVFLDDNSDVVAEGQSYDVTPMNAFKIDEMLEQPAAAKTVEVRVYNKDGDMLGVIESKAVELLSTVAQQAYEPSAFTLLQNYPNPFNPSTTIEYSLQQPQDVNLAIYDVNGRKVATLASGRKTAGNHKVVWNATQQAAGVYWLKLEADGRSASLKMLLLK